MRKLSLVLAVACVAGLLLFPACRSLEQAADVLADATEGTPEGDVFRGIARAAESMRDYSPAEEYYLGRAVAAEILSRYPVHPHKSLQDYVNLVGRSIVASAPEVRQSFSGYRFAVLEGEELQAVSAPGGFVFLTEGAVRRARDEDELAAVLAHEIAHVSLNHGIGAIKAATRKHSLALIIRGAGSGAVEESRRNGSEDRQRLAELAAVFADAVQEVTTDLLVTGYSREQEYEADRMAAVYLRSSGYARGALADYLRNGEREGAGGRGGWFQTHPAPRNRVGALRHLARGASPARPLRRERFERWMRGT